MAYKEAQACLDFFIPDVKNHWKVIPMGDLNPSQTFVATMIKIQDKWVKIILVDDRYQFLTLT